MKDEAASLALALQFLTRLPVPSSGVYTPERMAASVKYYPLVGALVGAISAAVFWSAQLILPHTLAIMLSIGASLLVTGAFHEDGLADTFDGVGGGQTREKALEIMKDSRLGTYGTLALIAALALKAGALTALPYMLAIAALIAAHALSRLSSVLVIATSRYVREEGTGKPVAARLSVAGLIFAALTGAAILGGWCVLQPPLALVYAGGGLLAGHITMRAFFERKLGGYTGDTLGAVQQASEIGFYLGLAIWL